MRHTSLATSLWHVPKLGKGSNKFKVNSEELPPPRGLKAFPPLKLPAIAALLVTVLVTVSARAADPFYLRLLRQGTDAFNRHDYQTAARELRIACFGLLDEPQLLADGLTRLALAQGATGDDAGFRETFQRLSEVEERFQGYSRADISKDVRAAFEQLVVQAIPPATLSENAAFARLVPSRQDNVSKLPPAQRRKELARLIKAEPREVRWRLMLADLELAEGNPREAYAAADGALKLSPGKTEALKLRGLALATDKKWSQAEGDLKACGFASSDSKVAGALLTCLVELKRWQEANDFAAQLPPDVAKDRTVQQLTVSAAVGLTASQPAGAPTPARAVPGGAKPGEKPGTGVTVATGVVAAGAAQTPTAKPAGKPTPPAVATRVVAGGSPQPSATKPTGKPAMGTASAGGQAQKSPAKGPLSTAEKADLDRAWDLAKAGNLDAAFALARKVADARPDLAEPQYVAAEIAYRTSRWRDAVAYFRRGGDPGDSQPLLVFYSAVALYETGDRAGAAAALKRCLPNIRRTPFVEEYAKKVLGDSTSVSQKP
ncbi:MAG TPA: tetratricopeptide repeat protein [Thermoanaerobaculaceae bacterium]|nr:tetratricopeptide repeat protein [Thermoanaerobaculaceae bacterium]